MVKQFFVYILTNKKHGTLYVGVTNNLTRRIFEHKEGNASLFTQKYKLKSLVYYEVFDNATNAIQREKNMKHYLRAWKIALIDANNPNWNDLWDEITA
jgi:putative endonuclease